MTPAPTSQGDAVLVGRALFEYSAYLRAFEAARLYRRMRARHAARFFVREARHRLAQFEELLLDAGRRP